MRRTGGTGTRTPFDTTRAAQAMQVPGIDPRHWVSYGTVCTMGDDGKPNFSDPQAVFTSPDGCHVDVLLHPAMVHVTARYSGVQGGSTGSIYTPIRPGDEVLVAIPDGDLREAPVIVRVMSAEHSRLPMGGDRKPIWQNDRVLIYGSGSKVHIEASGGAKIVVDTDGSVTIDAGSVSVNSGTKGAARLDDLVTTTMSELDVQALATQLLTTGAFVGTGAPNTPTPSTAPVVLTDGQIVTASGTVVVGD